MVIFVIKKEIYLMKNIFFYEPQKIYQKKELLPFFIFYPDSLKLIEKPMTIPSNMESILETTIAIVSPYMHVENLFQDKLFDEELNEKFFDFVQYFDSYQESQLFFTPKEFIPKVYDCTEQKMSNFLVAELMKIITYENIKDELMDWLVLASQDELYKMRSEKISSSSSEVCDFMCRIIKKRGNNLSQGVIYKEERMYSDKLRKFKSNYPLSQFMNFKRLTKERIPVFDSKLDIQFMCSLYSSVSASTDPFIVPENKNRKVHFSLERFWNLFSKMDIDKSQNNDISVIMHNAYLKERILNQKYIQLCLKHLSQINYDWTLEEIQKNGELTDRFIFNFMDFPLFKIRNELINFILNVESDLLKSNDINAMKNILAISSFFLSYIMNLLLPLTFGVFKYIFSENLNDIYSKKGYEKYKKELQKKFVESSIKTNEKMLNKMYEKRRNNRDEFKDIGIYKSIDNYIYQIYNEFNEMSKCRSQIKKIINFDNHYIKNKYSSFIFYSSLNNFSDSLHHLKWK